VNALQPMLLWSLIDQDPWMLHAQPKMKMEQLWKMDFRSLTSSNMLPKQWSRLWDHKIGFLLFYMMTRSISYSPLQKWKLVTKKKPLLKLKTCIHEVPRTFTQQSKKPCRWWIIEMTSPGTQPSCFSPMASQTDHPQMVRSQLWESWTRSVLSTPSDLDTILIVACCMKWLRFRVEWTASSQMLLLSELYSSMLSAIFLPLLLLTFSYLSQLMQRYYTVILK